MNKIFSIISQSITSLLKNKGRSMLSILGVTIGISTLIMIFAFGAALQHLLESQLSSFGTNYVQVEVKVPNVAAESSENAQGRSQGIVITTLTVEDGEAIKKIDNVTDYYAGTLDQKIIQYQNYDENSFIYGVSASYIDIDPHEIATGRFFDKQEEDTQALVAVLGSNKVKTIFGDEDPVGKRMKIGKLQFQVIGTLKEKGSNMFFDVDDMIYVPITTTTKRLLGVDYVTFIFAQIADNSLAEITKTVIEDVIRERHNITDPNKDDFAVTTFEQGLELLGTISGAASILLILIASISLIVGSVGIMNIMFVTVTERINEIGLRKAIGATKTAIQTQFLIEAMVLTGVGGVIGVCFGVLGVVGISAVATKLGFDWPVILEPHFFIISLGVSILVGLLAGYLPAQKAAGLDPIEALRK
ncbi:ABC transporter permease [Candidatus Falkowbacteria bacterium]|nr:ABC transporter permease [Candidatus Falkowbacteria bacterium]